MNIQNASDTLISAKGTAKDVTLANFKAEVLEASQQSVVLVLFWSARNASCKQFAAHLEKAASASKGLVQLARADVEKNQAIVQQMGVQSIPSVFAFYKGRPVDGFEGILPEAQLKTWIDRILQSTGADSSERAGLEKAFEQAEDHISTGDIDTASAIYADIMDMEPGNARAYAGLVRCCMEEKDTAKARELLNAAPAAIAADKALDAVKAAVELAEQAVQGLCDVSEIEQKVEQNPADHQTRFDLSLAYYAAGQREKAVDQLLELVRRDRLWNDASARKQLVKLFEAFGNSDPLTASARKRLSSILFS